MATNNFETVSFCLFWTMNLMHGFFFFRFNIKVPYGQVFLILLGFGTVPLNDLISITINLFQFSCGMRAQMAALIMAAMFLSGKGCQT